MEKLISYCAIFLMIGVIEYGRCDISCYSCSSKDDQTCLQPEKNNLPLKQCITNELIETKKHAESLNAKLGPIFDVSLLPAEDRRIVPMNCIKQVTTVGKHEYILRGCQLKIEHPDICNKVVETAKREHINVTYCALCETDGCNSAARFYPISFAFVLLPMVAVHLFKTT